MKLDCRTFAELDNQTLYEILAHRFAVFVLGQRLIYHDFDFRDQQALHLRALDEQNHLLGYVRLFPAGSREDVQNAHTFGRLSVREDCRHQGIGSALVREACRQLTEKNSSLPVEISAMAYLEQFYTELGFQRTSDVFLIEEVPHIAMRWSDKQK